MGVSLEVVCFTLEDVYRAREGGAHRIELCHDPGAGGITPSYGLIKQSVALGDIDVMVMIRPRGGDFLYTDEEIQEMQEDIQIAAELGAQGVVFGLLDKTGSLDKANMSRLVQLAKGLDLQVTCHRAFDIASNPYEFFDSLIEFGVDRLLTSGQQKTALEGMPFLRELIDRGKEKISIMPAGGVRPHNIKKLLELDITDIHSGSRIQVPSRMLKTSSKVQMGVDDDQEFNLFVDVDAVKAMLKATKKL